MASKSKRQSAPHDPVVVHPATNIPLNRLILSEANVRSIGADHPDACAGLAHSISQRSLLQSLMVRPHASKDGIYEVPGGGRRLRALQLLVEQGRLAADTPIPCIVKTDGIAEDDSLAENSDREDLHPLDEFRAFLSLREKGMGEEQIAAAYRVTAGVVKQRLRLASASPKILAAYEKDEITLDTVVAYCLTEDHKRQDEVFKALKKSHNHSAWTVRRMLTESTVEATDRRARFVGLEAYASAGGVVMRDLFKEEQAYLQDPTLLTTLVDQKLTAIRDGLLAKGWKWAEAAVELAYQNKQGMRQLAPAGNALTRKEQKHLDALAGEQSDIADRYPDEDDMPEKPRKRLEAIEAEIAELSARPPKFAEKDLAKAGVFVSLDHNGRVDFDYGYVRPEDEPKKRKANGHDADGDAETDADEAPRPGLPDSLVQDLTSYRTVALRNALAQDFNVAFLAVLHAMCLGQFYRRGSEAALQVTINDVFPANAPGLAEWAPTKAIDARRKHWASVLPKKPSELWEALRKMSEPDRAMLFADCASFTLNAVRQKHAPRAEAIRNAHQIAHALGFDMVAAGWTPTVDTYLGRVTKAQIAEAVKEGKDEASSQLIDHLKKMEMAKEAERLLAGSGWLPEPLRLPDQAELSKPADEDEDEEGDGLPEFLNESEEEGEAADAA
jgi:ParB family transcriptional regulator, chromosome partitioning protein